MKLIIFGLLISITLQAQSYRKTKREFRRAQKLSLTDIQKLDNKIISCTEYTGERGDTGDERTFSFLQESTNGFLELYTGDSFLLTNKGLKHKTTIPTYERTTEVRKTKRGDLVVKDTGIFSFYSLCKMSDVKSAKATQTMIKHDQEIKSATKIASNYYISSMDGVYLYKEGKKVKGIDFEKINNETNTPVQLTSLGLRPKLTNFKGEVYLHVYGLTPGTIDFHSLLFKLSNDLEKVKFMGQFDEARELRFSTDGHIYTTGVTGDRSGTKLFKYKLNGEKVLAQDFDKMRLPTSALAIANSKFVAISSYCDYRYRELLPCPEREINYAGITFISKETNQPLWIDEMIDFTMSPTDFSVTDDSLYVLYKNNADEISLFQYNSKGEKVRSLGLRTNDEFVMMGKYDTRLEIAENELLTRSGQFLIGYKL